MAKIIPVKIRCPKCGNICVGIIEETIPWETYFGHCPDCGYLITESDWMEEK